MVIVAHISRKGTPIADVTYRSGLHVEVRVAKAFMDTEITIPLSHSENRALSGTWSQALDEYFNEGTFHATEHLFPGERPRVGSAREHKALFRHAVRALSKDLSPLEYQVDVEFI